MRDSDPREDFTGKGPWERSADMADETNRLVASGRSWSGGERNHVFFGGLPGHQFARLSGISGLDDPGDSRAFAALDFDRDGWSDVALVGVSAPRLRLYRNAIGDLAAAEGRGSIAVRLVGGNRAARPSREWSARDGLGARVEVELDEGVSLHREHRVDDGFKSQGSATMLIGIGARDRARSLRVRWLSGRVQELADVAAGTLVTVYEDPAASPTGEAFAREAYVREPHPRLAPEAVAAAWRRWLFPAEPSPRRLQLAALGEATADLTLVTTMATWCVACAAEVPELEALRAAVGRDRLALVAVPVDDDDTPEELAAWSARHRPPYRLLAKLAAEEREEVRALVHSELRSEGVPATLVLDPRGNVLLARFGPPTVSEVRELLWRAEDGSRETEHGHQPNEQRRPR